MTERTAGGWRVPPAARLLGLAGLIPFFGLALLSLAGETWARMPLLFYGASILSFLGAVHWGAALRGTEAEAGWDWPRLGIGVMPSLVAWVALLLPAGWDAGLLILGFLCLVLVESVATRTGAVGRNWLRLRWVLTIGAVLSLFLGEVLVF
ncbi:DUF3429 domain-containing protein [Roseomonas elaeocarpi]|uniref:DUF3429 domain-containing protein n=1 Tax=Roseomonas elaeocarpi TaxID=907779 RepID=A0ABV6JXU0_9PROT